jgi:hypothetical protein
MSLDKTKRRVEKVRAENRRRRKLGLVELTEPGPWFSLGGFAFEPTTFPGLTDAETPEDADLWPLTRK